MTKKTSLLNPVAAGIRIALTSSTVLLMAAAGFSAQAEEATADKKAEENVEKIVVVGSRGAPRSIGDSTVPVDVIGGDEFASQGPSDMMTLMSSVVPSFSVNTQPISDAATFVRPANLRGLPPDSTLVLVNGKRRHRSAVINFIGGGLSDGSQGPDISVIPSIALKQVEVLRDGAAAQYGSDAIAGVLNFRLKDANEGGAIELKTGQFYEGDGTLRQVAANVGLPFTDNGFANFSTEFKQSDPTNRSVQIGDAAALAANGNTFINNPAQVWGVPEFKRDFKLFGNIGLEVAKNKEFYMFGNLAERDVEGGFYYRDPQGHGVYTSDKGKTLRIGNYDLTKTCPTITLTGKNFSQVNAEVGALPDHCFTFFKSLPGGFTPKFGGIITDASLAAGLKGEFDNGWAFDLSSMYGRSEAEFYIKDTVNPSLGKNSPRDFKAGKYVQQEQAVNYDMHKLVDVDFLPYPLAVAGGLEYRIDTFEIYAGDKNSFAIGPLASQGFGIGSNGFSGFKPDDAGSFNRYNYAGYLEFGAEFTDKFRSDFAGRFENYEDFGSTANFKLTGRFQATDTFALRGAASTGFRAPTIGQSMVRNVTTSFSAIKGLTDTATLPPTNPISLQKGSRALTPEESVNLSFGGVLEVDDFYLTLDFYDIAVEDRISLSSAKTLSTDDIKKLVDLGITDAGSYSGVRFFNNDFDTTTRGIDLVANYGADLLGGRTTFALAMNYNSTKIDEVSEFVVIGDDGKPVLDAGGKPVMGTNINPAKEKQIEEGLPKLRGSFTVSQHNGDLRGYVRLNHYGSSFEDHADSGSLDIAEGGTPISLGSELTVDVEATYAIDENFEISIGANNLLDAVPDENPWSANLGAKYPTTSLIGFNGGFYYGRLNYKF